MNQKVDEYLEKKAQNWQRPFLAALRKCILDCGLTEEVKWGAPVYTHHGNVVGLGAFNNHIALWFFEGGTLKDASKVLMNAQEGKTMAMRQWRFVAGDAVNEKLVKAYITEAALNMERGIKTRKSAAKIEVVVPALLQEYLDADPEMKAYFKGLAPSHRRDFSDHISGAKQEATRLRRLEKVKGLLLQKKGLHDKYKN